MVSEQAPNGPAIVLANPQMGENIGAAARVMANFGLSDLRLVSPRDGWPNPRAQAMAAGAMDRLVQVRLFESTREALADCSLAFAVSARLRDMQKDVLTPLHGCARLRALGPGQGRGALLFGPEASGLANADVTLCDALITCPVAEAFGSLNLAQAVAVLAYEWRAGDERAARPPVAPLAEAADKAAQTGLFEHLEQALERAGFFFPPQKTPLMQQNIRNALIRARLTEQEVRTFRGIVRALENGRGGAKKAKQS